MNIAIVMVAPQLMPAYAAAPLLNPTVRKLIAERGPEKEIPDQHRHQQTEQQTRVQPGVRLGCSAAARPGLAGSVDWS